MTKTNFTTLKSSFFRNSASRFAFNHAAQISSYLYTVCNSALLAKHGIEVFAENGIHLEDINDISHLIGTIAHCVDLETGAGLLWTISSMSLRLSKKHPELAFRLSGAALVMGAGLLAASGIHDGGATIDWWKTISPILGYGTTGSLLFFQNEIANLAKKFENSDCMIVRGLCKAAHYPVVAGALIDCFGSGGVLKSSIHNGKIGLTAIFAGYFAAAGGLAASDPLLQNEFEKENASQTNVNLLAAKCHKCSSL